MRRWKTILNHTIFSAQAPDHFASFYFAVVSGGRTEDGRRHRQDGRRDGRTDGQRTDADDGTDAGTEDDDGDDWTDTTGGTEYERYISFQNSTYDIGTNFLTQK